MRLLVLLFFLSNASFGQSVEGTWKLIRMIKNGDTLNLNMSYEDRLTNCNSKNSRKINNPSSSIDSNLCLYLTEKGNDWIKSQYFTFANDTIETDNFGLVGKSHYSINSDTIIFSLTKTIIPYEFDKGTGNLVLSYSKFIKAEFVKVDEIYNKKIYGNWVVNSEKTKEVSNEYGEIIRYLEIEAYGEFIDSTSQIKLGADEKLELLSKRDHLTGTFNTIEGFVYFDYMKGKAKRRYKYKIISDQLYIYLSDTTASPPVIFNRVGD